MPALFTSSHYVRRRCPTVPPLHLATSGRRSTDTPPHRYYCPYRYTNSRSALSRLESPESTVPVTVPRSDDRSRRSKSRSTPSTLALSAARTPLSARLSASGSAVPARRSWLAVLGPSAPRLLPLSDRKYQYNTIGQIQSKE